MYAEIGDTFAVDCFRFASLNMLKSDTVFDDPVWQDWKGNNLSLFKMKNAVGEAG